MLSWEALSKKKILIIECNCMAELAEYYHEDFIMKIQEKRNERKGHVITGSGVLRGGSEDWLNTGKVGMQGGTEGEMECRQGSN